MLRPMGARRDQWPRMRVELPAWRQHSNVLFIERYRSTPAEFPYNSIVINFNEFVVSMEFVFVAAARTSRNERLLVRFSIAVFTVG